MRPDTMPSERETISDDRPTREPTPPPRPSTGPLSGIERAAFFAALRRKADQRVAEFG
ncbi:MAG: hypothetical protein MUC89_09995 [Acetobacteraceae bacterium]|jgi:hypothetical protein|nr:hypothetical protein [Acetobacteraceae bacterium]